MGVHYKIVDLKMCIMVLTADDCFLNHQEHFPCPAEVALEVWSHGWVHFTELNLKIQRSHSPTVHCGCQQCELPAEPGVFYFWGIVWVTVIFFIDRPDQRSMLPDLNKTVSLHLTDQAWLRPCCGSCLSLSFLLSSLLQPDTLPQLPQIAL